jgi:hypothetical protein
MTPGIFDFDIHGFVGVRLVDAGPAEVALVERQLGPLERTLHRQPDITVRFVDRFTRRDLTYIGMGETGFNEDGFFTLRGRGAVPGRTLLPLDRVGLAPEIVCERTVPAVPHLLTLVNLTALSHDVLPLHASAFTADGAGVLVTGWSKGGKTESLLAACLHGAEYVGDEWVYLTPDGQMFGVPEPIRLWGWQLAQLPELLGDRPVGERLRLRSWRAASAVAGMASSLRWPGAGVARRGAPVIARQDYVQVPPVELFGQARVRLRGSLDAIVLVLSHSGPGTDVSPMSAARVADRITASLSEERAAFMSHYRQFRFAFPERRSAIVEDAAAREAVLLAEIFAGRPAVMVSHPYPCDIRDLGGAVLTAAARLAHEQSEPVEVNLP